MSDLFPLDIYLFPFKLAQPHLDPERVFQQNGSIMLEAPNQTGFIVCVEVLRPSQPNGVMSSTVSLPNHAFTEQA